MRFKKGRKKESKKERKKERKKKERKIDDIVDVTVAVVKKSYYFFVSFITYRPYVQLVANKGCVSDIFLRMKTFLNNFKILYFRRIKVILHNSSERNM
jgi:hypothetical protein